MTSTSEHEWDLIVADTCLADDHAACIRCDCGCHWLDLEDDDDE